MALTFITTSDIIVNASMAFSFSSFLSIWVFMDIPSAGEERGTTTVLLSTQSVFTSQLEEVTILAFGATAASISINQQRHGKGISTFAVQKPCEQQLLLSDAAAAVA